MQFCQRHAVVQGQEQPRAKELQDTSFTQWMVFLHFDQADKKKHGHFAHELKPACDSGRNEFPTNFEDAEIILVGRKIEEVDWKDWKNRRQTNCGGSRNNNKDNTTKQEKDGSDMGQSGNVTCFWCRKTGPIL